VQYAPDAAPGALSTVFGPASGQNGLCWAAVAAAFGSPISGPPTVVSVVPANGPTAGGTAVVITGTNFTSGAAVTFGANAASDVVVLSSTEITCITPPGPPGPVTVAVTDTLGTGSLAGGYTYIAGGGGGGGGRAYGNLYSLDEQKFTDDDYGQMSPYYCTYFFVNHEQEQILGLGTDLKLVRKICAFIAGIGYVTITPLVDSLNNPLPATTPRILSADANPANLVNQDLEWTVAVRGERISFRIAVFPLPGTTDVQMRLQKIIPHMMKSAVIYHHGSAV